MGKPRVKRKDDELRRASVHVWYELMMLVEAAKRLDPEPDDYPMKCALLESFTVHARNLHHFLWPQNEGPDNVLAYDYFDGPWEAPSPPVGQALTSTSCT
jgi:hypothetical protein